MLAKALAPRSRSVSKCRQAWHGPAWSGKDTMQSERQVYAAASTAAYPCLSHWVVVPQIPPTAVGGTLTLPFLWKELFLQPNSFSQNGGNSLPLCNGYQLASGNHLHSNSSHLFSKDTASDWPPTIHLLVSPKRTC